MASSSALQASAEREVKKDVTARLIFGIAAVRRALSGVDIQAWSKSFNRSPISYRPAAADVWPTKVKAIAKVPIMFGKCTTSAYLTGTYAALEAAASWLAALYLAREATRTPTITTPSPTPCQRCSFSRKSR